MSGLIVFHVTIIIVAGLVAGWVCRRLGVSILIGYMLAGSILGPGVLDITGSRQAEEANTVTIASAIVQQNVESETPISMDEGEINKQIIQHATEDLALETVAEFGVMLLLFAIGIEFSLDKLLAMLRYMFVGGVAQMLLTGIPAAIICHLLGQTWNASIIIACVISLSSTALVFKSMEEEGIVGTHRSKATIGVLLFQDLALVPMLLLIPILSGGAMPTPEYWATLVAKSLMFCAVVVIGKLTVAKIIVPRLAQLRANELIILFVLSILFGLCGLAIFFGLTPALGALAAGLILAENRLTHQIDALILPFREAFSAIFFISLGMLMDFSYVWNNPLPCLVAFLIIIALKTAAGAVALKMCGFKNRSALGFGLCMSQVGELAFMLLTAAYAAHAVPQGTYNTVLFVSVASLVLTPNIVHWGLKIASKEGDLVLSSDAGQVVAGQPKNQKSALEHVIIVGAGHIGSHLGARLETMGKSVCLIDFSPINLHRFAQEGFTTISGDASSPKILQKAGIDKASMVYVTVPDDMIAMSIVRSCHELNPKCTIMCRARYQLNIKPLQRAGAEMVVCEESNVCNTLLKLVSGGY